MNGKRTIATTLFFIALPVALGHFILALGGHDRTSSSETRMPLLRVRPSYLLRGVDRQLGRRQSVPVSQIIAEANSELTRRGFDYEFEVSGFITKHRLKPLRQLDPNVSPTAPYEFDLKTLQGAPLRLQVDVDIEEGPCGERGTLIPAARVTNQEIELVVDSQHYHVKRPSGFGLESMQLVDAETKKTLRTWELPFYPQLLGVSLDGSTLFFLPNFDIYSSGQNTALWVAAVPIPMGEGLQLRGRPTHLILAVSDRGVQFANDYELIEQESSEILEDRDPNFPYVGYKRFHVGDKSYVVRFQWPCT